MKLKYFIDKTSELIHTLMGHTTLNYSQDGEDLIFQHIFLNKKNGFYVDIGAHHPFRFSNTYFLYMNKWRGINIDPTPGSMKLFNKHRKRDINLEIAITNSNAQHYLFQFDEPALNFISSEGEESLLIKDITRKYKKKLIICSTLREVLNKYLFSNKPNLLIVDTEGKDLNVLMSNDWTKYKFEVVMVEIDKYIIENIYESPTHKYLLETGYILAYKTFRNAIYFCRNYYKESTQNAQC